MNGCDNCAQERQTMKTGHARIPDDVLEDLRWMADTPHAIAVVPKAALRALLDAYERQIGKVIQGQKEHA